MRADPVGVAAVHITCPRGSHARPFMVVQADRRRLRIAHVRDLTEAEHLQADWRRADYAFNPGQLRYFLTSEKP